MEKKTKKSVIALTLFSIFIVLIFFSLMIIGVNKIGLLGWIFISIGIPYIYATFVKKHVSKSYNYLLYLQDNISIINSKKFHKGLELFFMGSTDKAYAFFTELKSVEPIASQYMLSLYDVELYKKAESINILEEFLEDGKIKSFGDLNYIFAKGYKILGNQEKFEKYQKLFTNDDANLFSNAKLV